MKVLYLFGSPSKVSGSLSLIAERGPSVISSSELSGSSGVSESLSDDDGSDGSEGSRSSTSSGGSGCCCTASASDSLEILAARVLGDSALVVDGPAAAVACLGASMVSITYSALVGSDSQSVTNTLCT